MDLLINTSAHLSSKSVVLLVSQKQVQLGLSLWLVVPQASPQVFSALVSPAKGTAPSVPHPHSRQIGRSCQGLTTGQWYYPAQWAGSGNLLNGKVQMKLFFILSSQFCFPKPWHTCCHHVQNRITGPFLLSYRIPRPVLLSQGTSRQETNHVSQQCSTLPILINVSLDSCSYN